MDLKKLTGAKTSEELFAISKQPKELCPTIDTIKDKLSDSKSEVKHICRDSEQTVGYFGSDLRNIESDLHNSMLELEDLRAEIITLRSWGDEWKCLAKEMASVLDVDSLPQFIGSEYIEKYLLSKNK